MRKEDIAPRRRGILGEIEVWVNPNWPRAAARSSRKEVVNGDLARDDPIEDEGDIFTRPKVVPGP